MYKIAKIFSLTTFLISVSLSETDIPVGLRYASDTELHLRNPMP